MKSNTWTIVRKEFARFFGDRQLLFSTVLLPGVLIYFVYSIMGAGIGNIMTEGADEVVTLQVENMPPSLQPLFAEMEATAVVDKSFAQADIDALEDDDLNVVLMRFPADFDEMVAQYTPQCGVPAPNVEIYYNSANNASMRVYTILTTALTAYEDSMSNRFDVNRADSPDQTFDIADADDVLGNVWSKMLPMLIVMMLFSGVMSIAPASIAGEKERGTIATLLATPMRRNELAIGKIISLSAIALLSGVSSFIGIALALPKMIHADAADVDLGLHYVFADYVVLLLIIFATVLIMATVVSMLSALAKDTKNAGTMVTPLMLVVMVAGLMPMFQNGTTGLNPAVYLIPFYNSIEVMTALFARELTTLPVVLTVASNVVYTALGVWGLTRLFNSEKVMFAR